MILVNIFWANELSGQYVVFHGEGQIVQETEEMFYEDWAGCMQALQEEFPDDEWGTDDATIRMRQKGWRMEAFDAVLDLDLA